MPLHYEGEAFTTEELLDLISSKGIIIEDEARARQVLQNVSYTRLKSYLKPGSTFEKAYALYGFDRRLRELIFHEMEKIEISIRTRMAYVSNGLDKGYWFTNEAHFKSGSNFQWMLRHLQQELDRSDNESILHFKEKYDNPFPPSWITFEAASMGTLQTIYSNILDQSLREEIASYYGLRPAVFLSWVKHLVWLRNSCAHHNRVWNNTPSVKATLPSGLAGIFPDIRDKDRLHIYFSLCIIKYFIDSIKPDNSFSTRLKVLIHSFKDVDPALMGFPPLWEDSVFWKRNSRGF